MSKHNTTRTDRQLLDEAYKCSHVIADQMEKVILGKTTDIHWMLKEARALSAALQELECRKRGQRPEKLIG